MKYYLVCFHGILEVFPTDNHSLFRVSKTVFTVLEFFHSLLCLYF